MVKNHPSCPEVAHVYVAFGEHYFAQGELDNARQFYRKAATFPDPAIVAYAVYKLAWCDINLGDAAQALANFVKVIEAADRGGPSEELQRLRDAALRDSALVYADAGDPRKAAAFYRKIAGEEGMKRALRHLAQIYADRGAREEASVVCEAGGPGTCQ